MKKVLMLVFAMCFLLSMSALAQGSMGSDTGATKKKAAKTEAKSDAMAAETSVNGTITTNKAGKAALKADDGGALWTIENPEVIKGHEGHHVTVSGHPNATKKTIHIMKVDMMADAPKSDSKAKKSSSKKGGARKG